MDIFTSFKKEFGLILVSAVIFIASFLWKDLISDVREKYFPHGYGLLGRTIFTLVISIGLILLVIFIRNVFGLANRNDEKDKSDVTFDDSPLEDENHIDTNDFETIHNIDMHDSINI